MTDIARHMVLFQWDRIKKNRGAFLNKIYGFRVRGKAYQGLIGRYNGMKSGKSAVIFPIEHKDEIIALIKKHGVNAKVKEIFI